MSAIRHQRDDVHPDDVARSQAARARVVLLDMGLSDADTVDVLRRVRRDEPGIGVVIMTGNRQLALARIGFDLGAVDWLFKPFGRGRLVPAPTRS